MIELDNSFDEILNVNYKLYSLSLQELKDLIISWYPNINFDEFNEDSEKHECVREEFDKFNKIVKEAGLVSNYFFAYKEDNEYYLLDGFNRLLTEYGKTSINQKVYIKIIETKLKDNDLMRIMLYLNLWKLYKTGSRNLHVSGFMDRGMRLLFYKKFGIRFINEDYSLRTRSERDFGVLNYYFRDEYESSCDFYLEYKEIYKLMNNIRIIDDIRELCNNNNYMEEDKFNHYDKFLHGFTMFLTRRRIMGDNKIYRFEDFIKILKIDKKFFNKLQKMSWTDSTRKNIYRWFNVIEEKMNNKEITYIGELQNVKN